MNRDDIEDAVKVKVPVSENLDQLLKLFGEDALLDWPGALVPVVDERDQYMARNLHAAASGITCGFVHQSHVIHLPGSYSVTKSFLV